MDTPVQNPALYKALEIPTGSTFAQIKRGFYKKAKNSSPDKHLNHPDWSGLNERFAYLLFAYEILKKPETREIYDTKGFKGLKAKGVNVPAGFENYKDPLTEELEDTSKKLEQFKAKLAREMKLLEDYWAERIQERMRLQEEARQKFHFATYKQIVQIAWKKEIICERRKIFGHKSSNNKSYGS